MIRNAWLIPLIPAISFFIILFFGKRLPKKGAEVGIGAVGLCLLMSIISAGQWIANDEVVSRHLTWFKMGGVQFGAGIHMDGLAVMMLFVVTLISLMVHIYSTGYMHGDRRYTYFFAALSLFTAAMLNLVVADNTLQFLVGWEGVGLCSFMLIGHWFEEKNNSDAALKAFITTRIGDIGLLVGIVTLFFAAGKTFNIEHLNQLALSGHISHGLLLAGAALLFMGVVGKSAQFPLHVWLPDAMAGPTPVSALIHAATMVVAGVYLVARLYGVFWQGFSIEAGGINLVALIGGITMIIAAGLAFVQSDIKRVLAYSTISQLGYMVAALGVGAWTAGVFHLFTHAFFKALLFLGSGSVIHACDTNSMFEMGGLRKVMPTTFRTFIIGSLALAGIFPLAGFFSKDEILLGASKNGFPIILVLGLIGAFMTACYMGRACFLTFWGEYRGDGHPHESPRSMTVPLVILSVLSVTAGWLNFPGVDKFTEWVPFRVPGVAFHPPHHEFNLLFAVLTSIPAFLGIGIAAWVYYWQTAPKGVLERSAPLRALHTLLVEKYYLDRIFVDGIIGSIKGPIARAVYWVNQNVIDGAVNGVAFVAQKLARLTYEVIDQKVVDGAVNGVGVTASEAGGALRLMQSGRVQQYAAILFAAVGLLGLAVTLFT